MKEHEQVYELVGTVYSRLDTAYLYLPTKCGKIILWDPRSNCMILSHWGRDGEYWKFMTDKSTRYELTIPMNNIQIYKRVLNE